jgi:hypothetical protein
VKPVSPVRPVAPRLPAAGLLYDPAVVWLLSLFLIQIACQIALLVEYLAPMRVVFRTVPFLSSMAGLVFVPGVARRRHPSQPWALAALAVLGLGVLHPSTSSPVVAFAAFSLYLAILAPLFWVPRLSVTPSALSLVLGVVWGFNTLSATVAVLQVYFPGRFQPHVSEIVQNMGEIAEGLKIELADGSTVWRPMGLSDVPGGAAAAGLNAVVFGLGFLAVSRRWLVRAAGVAGIMVGLFCIYLAQLRVALVIAGIVSVAFAAALVWLRRGADAARLLVVLPVVAVASFAWAFAVGGETVTRRLETLVEDRPEAVYYSNRGRFLEETVYELLPRYPLGAGLGRWGMVRRYFGDPDDPWTESIWVEIQWTAWVVDGGIPLTIAYAAAILAALWASARIARRTRDRVLAGWAALVLAYDVSFCGLIFSYAPFIGQPGVEFWVLNAAVFAAATTVRRPGPR